MRAMLSHDPLKRPAAVNILEDRVFHVLHHHAGSQDDTIAALREENANLEKRLQAALGGEHSHTQQTEHTVPDTE